MRRRDLVVGAGGLALTALAGCLGSGRETLDEQPAENAVVDDLRNAIGEANVVALELATAREEAASPAEVSFDEEALADRLATSRQALDSASQREAGDDYEAELTAAGSYVDVVDGLLAGSASLVEAATELQSVESSIAAGEYGVAGQTLDSIQQDTLLDDARSTTAEAQSTAESLDARLLDPYGAKMGELTDGLASIAELTIGADEVAGGYASVLTGQDHLEAGGTAFQQGDFGTAESEFQAAGDAFANATAQFETARQETSGQLATQIDVALCRSTALEDAATHFENSAAAADAGDFIEAQDERQAGQSDVSAAESCGS